MDYYNSQIITYLGNKRKLLPHIEHEIIKIGNEIGKKKLKILDGFSGSGIVARMLKTHSEELYVNDIEGYSKTLNTCYLSNKDEVPIREISNDIKYLNINKLISQPKRLISMNYAPKTDDNIKPDERVYFSQKNAIIIDNIRQMISKLPKERQVYSLAPLLVQSSIHNNCCGQFNAFYKKDGIGHFGGKNSNALDRILCPITLPTPIFSNHNCKVKIFQDDINNLVISDKIPEMDIVYYDPPYNKHPYGTYYFMLNVINDYNLEETEVPKNSRGQQNDWKRSEFNSFVKAQNAFDKLIKNTRAKYIIISYNTDGIIPQEELHNIMKKYGSYEVKHITHGTYNRLLGQSAYKSKKQTEDMLNSKKNTETLWILKKSK